MIKFEIKFELRSTWDLLQYSCYNKNMVNFNCDSWSKNF